MTEPAVGIFWWVDEALVAAGCAISEAEDYAGKLGYPGGHADHWERWQAAGGRWLARHDLPAVILSSDYEAHPRGRIVRDGTAGPFLLYADRRLHKPERIAAIVARFGLEGERIWVRSDPHYR